MADPKQPKGRFKQSPSAGSEVPWDVSMVSFGLPSHPRTSSGYAANLARALRTGGHVRKEFSAKLIRPLDLCRGALRVDLKHRRPSVSIRRAWMWSAEGSELLSRRLDAHIRRMADRGPFLQVGTLVQIDTSLGPHLMRTDMTIAQARRAGRFAVSELAPKALDDAQALQAKILSQAAHVFAASQWTADSLIADCGVAPERITVLYTGGNLSLPPHLEPPRADREILFVGIDWERKGGPLLLEAFRIVHERLPDATLRIVGCSPEVGHRAVLVEGMLDKRNPQHAQRLAHCYLRASCFCLPTLFDPFPNAIIEAASAGLAAVAVDNGSRREAIIDGVTGVLAAHPSAESVAAALLAVLEDPDRARRMGAAAKEHVRAHFNWESVVEKVGTVVRNLETMRVPDRAEVPAAALR